MRMRINPDAKVAVEGGDTERAYEAWKRAKIERGLAQSRDREAMIPVDRLWHDLSLRG